MTDSLLASPALSSASSSAAGDAERALKAQRAREKLKKFSKKKAANQTTQSPLVHSISTPTPGSESSSVPPSPALSAVSATHNNHYSYSHGISPSTLSNGLDSANANVDLDESSQGEIDFIGIPETPPQRHQQQRGHLSPIHQREDERPQARNLQDGQPDNQQERLQGIDELLFGSGPSSSSGSLAKANLELKKAQELAHARQQTIAMLVSEKSQLSTALTSSKEDLESLRDRLHEALALKDDHDRLKTRISTLQAELAESQAVAATKRSECEAFKAKATALEAEIDSTSSSLASARSDLQATESELSKLRADLERREGQSREVISSLESQIQTKNADTKSLELELSKEQKVNMQQKEEKKLVEVELAKFKAINEQQAAASQALEAEKTKFQNHVLDLSHTIEDLQSSASTLQRQLADTQAHLSDAQAALSQTREDLDRANSELANTQEALSSAEAGAVAAAARRDALQKDNSDLMADLADLRSKMVKLTDENTDLGEKAESLHRAVRDRDHELSRIKSQLETASLNLDQARSDLTQRELTLHDTQEEMRGMQGRMEQAQSELRTREGDLRLLQQTLADSQTAFRDSQEAAAQATAEAQDTRHRLDTEIEASGHEREANEQLRNDIAALREQAQAYEKEIEELRQQILEEQRQQKHLGSPPPDISPLPQTPFAATPQRSSTPVRNRPHTSEASLSQSVIVKNNSEALEEDEWPTSDDEESGALRSPLKSADTTRQDNVRSHTALSYDEEDMDRARHQLRQLEADLSASRTDAAMLNHKVQVAEQKVDELNALILIERQKTMKAMAEVFALGSSNADISPSTSTSASPIASRTKARPAPLHRRSASHLPTLTESLDNKDSGDVSPRGTTFPKKVQPQPFMPPHAKHARRESLSQLQTRMQAELGPLPDISVITPTPVVTQLTFNKEASLSPQQQMLQQPRRKSARLYNDHIFCAACTGDLLVI